MMPSLFAQYKKEREGVEIVETDVSFATYKFVNGGDTVYIIDVYVKPEARRSHAAIELGNVIVEIAKNRGAKYVLGSVDPLTNGATESIKGLIAWGMKVLKIEGRLILFRKEI